MPPRFNGEDESGIPSQGFENRRDNTLLYEKLDVMKDSLNTSIQGLRTELYREVNKTVANQTTINEKLIALNSKVGMLTWVSQLVAGLVITVIGGAILSGILVK